VKVRKLFKQVEIPSDETIVYRFPGMDIVT